MKNKRKIKDITLCTLFIIALIIISGLLWEYDQQAQVPSFNEYRIVAHGLGGLPNEKRVTNSIDALEENYQKGTRIFEVDLIETSDGYIVARHDWLNYLYDMLEQTQPTAGEECILTLEEFKNMTINKHYQPATLDDLLELMKKYPDIYLVTDTKTTTAEDTIRVFEKIVSSVKETDANLLSRIYPQIYNQESYHALKEVYPFENILYTVYYETAPRQEILDFSIQHGIAGIVMPDYYYTQDFVSQIAEAGIDVYVHTVNDLEAIKNYLSSSVTGIYSDYIGESDLLLETK